MNNPAYERLLELPRETLIELIQLYSRNWMTLDGLWFSGVEEKYGMDAAVELDVRMWRIGSKTEAKRIQKLFNLGPGLENIIKAIDFMSWAYRFGYEYEIKNKMAVWTCSACPPQENRLKAGLVEFPCKPTFEACFGNVATVIDPRVEVTCNFCPPDEHPKDAWCQWEFKL